MIAAQALLNQGYGLPRQHLAVGLPDLRMVVHAPGDTDAARINGEDVKTGRWDA